MNTTDAPISPSKNWTSNSRQQAIWYSVAILFALGAALQLHLKGVNNFDGVHDYTFYNNWIIFKQSFFHLLDGKPLYVFYPEEYYDLYKYAPPFAILMAPLAILPEPLGMVIWTLLNTVLLVRPLRVLLAQSGPWKWLVIVAVGIELLTSLQNAQSNGLIAGLILWMWLDLVSGKSTRSILWLLLAITIKPFAILAAVLYIFYPSKLKTIAIALVGGIVLLALPLPLLGLGATLDYYAQWGVLLQSDHDFSVGFSVMGILYSWFALEPSKLMLTGIGAFLFLFPFLVFPRFNNREGKLLVLASALLWMVIFNHRAESPTFVLAAVGMAIWFAASKKGKIRNAWLLAFILLTALAPSDLYPRVWRKSFFEPFYIKAVVPIALWIWITIRLYSLAFTEGSFSEKVLKP